MTQVLFSYSWEDLIRSVAWVKDGGVMLRILASDGSTFERTSSSRSLTEEWSMESIYCFYRPAMMTLPMAFSLLGRSIDFLDNFESGPLAAPVHWSLRQR